MNSVIVSCLRPPKSYTLHTAYDFGGLKHLKFAIW